MKIPRKLSVISKHNWFSCCWCVYCAVSGDAIKEPLKKLLTSYLIPNILPSVHCPPSHLSFLLRSTGFMNITKWCIIFCTSIELHSVSKDIRVLKLFFNLIRYCNQINDAIFAFTPLFVIVMKLSMCSRWTLHSQYESRVMQTQPIEIIMHLLRFVSTLTNKKRLFPRHYTANLRLHNYSLLTTHLLFMCAWIIF